MGRVKLAKVLSFSSEDHNHPAENLLNINARSKWQCQSPGENTAFVTFQLEQPTVIRSLDIANNNSGFVEVLVGRSGINETDYKLLLPSSSLMTPIDSRNSMNGNRVRMFGPDKLSLEARKEKWDVIKFVCSQPFNSHLKYGLTFIAIHEQDKITDSTSTLNEKPSFGSLFKLKTEESSELNVGNIFRKFKSSNEPAKPVIEKVSLADSALKESQKLIENIKKAPDLSPSKVKIAKERKTNQISIVKKQGEKRKLDSHLDLPARNKMIWDADSEIKSSDLKAENDDKWQDRNLKAAQAMNSSSGASPTTSSVESVSKSVPSSVTVNGQSQQSCTYQAKNKKPIIRRPFNKLMKDVVFVMSGYVNPKRSQFRDMALEMGAKYKPDWDKTCTHLICAFVNTPKFQEVYGKGKIVKETWITESYRQKKRLPWRRHCLDKKDRGPESEDEIWSDCIKEKDDNDESVKQKFQATQVKQPYQISNSFGEKEDMEASDEDSEYEASTDYSRFSFYFFLFLTF
ncbi:hypothetical protein QYM36_014965 [Artemia franciscana]|uniref:BRCT domain-containing protein n=1 Tax=Artemia franciscana TaxID=6661 RepID=A0AA88HKK0_ARTSF|nr:hypothetical protein QYM36_014965 [Artemia franciscana]